MHTVDLICTLINPGNAGIAISGFHRGIGTVTHSAIYLHAFIYHKTVYFRPKNLKHGTLNGILFHTLELSFWPGHSILLQSYNMIFHLLTCPISGTFGSPGKGGHICQLLLNSPKRSKALAKLLAFISVLYRVCNYPSICVKCGYGQLYTA